MVVFIELVKDSIELVALSSKPIIISLDDVYEFKLLVVDSIAPNLVFVDDEKLFKLLVAVSISLKIRRADPVYILKVVSSNLPVPIG